MEDCWNLLSIKYLSTIWQMSCTTMDSKTSPTLIQHVMDDLFDDSAAKLTFHLDFVKKYVNDIFCASSADQFQFWLFAIALTNTNSSS